MNKMFDENYVKWTKMFVWIKTDKQLTEIKKKKGIILKIYRIIQCINFKEMFSKLTYFCLHRKLQMPLGLLYRQSSKKRI